MVREGTAKDRGREGREGNKGSREPGLGLGGRKK